MQRQEGGSMKRIAKFISDEIRVLWTLLTDYVKGGF